VCYWISYRGSVSSEALVSTGSAGADLKENMASAGGELPIKLVAGAGTSGSSGNQYAFSVRVCWARGGYDKGAQFAFINRKHRSEGCKATWRVK
jgi:hypothetical protein